MWRYQDPEITYESREYIASLKKIFFRPRRPQNIIKKKMLKIEIVYHLEFRPFILLIT